MSDPEEGWLSLKDLKFKRKILECVQQNFIDTMSYKLKLIDSFITKYNEKEQNECSHIWEMVPTNVDTLRNKVHWCSQCHKCEYIEKEN